MKVVTGKGAVKPSDLFISTAISFKKCLSRLLLLQSRNMTAHCRSEINPKASETAGNNSLQRRSHHPPSPCLSQPALENIESRENDVCFLFLFLFFLHSLSMLCSLQHRFPRPSDPGLSFLISIKSHIPPVTYSLISAF